MIEMTVGDFKAQFSNVLELVMNGTDVNILYGRAKKPVATLSKIEEKSGRRKIGTFDNLASFSEIDDGKITLEEFLGE